MKSQSMQAQEKGATVSFVGVVKNLLPRVVPMVVMVVVAGM
jgi:hypothetical protein